MTQNRIDLYKVSNLHVTRILRLVSGGPVTDLNPRHVLPSCPVPGTRGHGRGRGRVPPVLRV